MIGALFKVITKIVICLSAMNFATCFAPRIELHNFNSLKTAFSFVIVQLARARFHHF